MTKYISVPLKVEGISEFYWNCVESLGYTKDDVDNLDCRKIEVSFERFNHIEKFYQSKGCSRTTFGMDWCMYGPKANDELHGEVVCLEDGFITLKGE